MYKGQCYIQVTYKKRRSLSRFLFLTWVTWPLKSIHFHKWLHFEITQWVKIILPKKEPIKCLTTLLWIFHNFYVWKCYIVTATSLRISFQCGIHTYLLQKKKGFFFSYNFCSKYARTCLKTLLDYATAEWCTEYDSFFIFAKHNAYSLGAWLIRYALNFSDVQNFST